MNPSANRHSVQMHLLYGEEWAESGSHWSGTEVYRFSGRASEGWLSDCRKEKALTGDLMEEISSLSNLASACAHVVKNKGQGGVDGMEVGELSSWFSTNWRSLQAGLLSGNYQPSSVRGVAIEKGSGGKRQLGIPTVKDRLVQQAIHQVLSPRYEKVFSNQSYGFRPRRSAHMALKEAGVHIRSGKNYIVDMDLSKFFDEVNHDRLLWQLSLRVGDTTLLKLIAKFLRSGILEGGLESQRVKGTPQGGPLSPLLSNIVLDELDKELELRGHSFVRYADDFLIFVSSARAATRVKASVKSYVEQKLLLKVNEQKSRISRPYGLNFLGHGFQWDGGLFLSGESEKKLKGMIRTVTRRNRSASLGTIIKELNQKLRGWLYYFRYARMKKKLRYLISWLHRKLRCYRLKQGKRPIGIMRILHRCGVPKNRAWTTAASRKGWWRKSATPAANEAMNGKWFIEQGLLDIKNLYLKLHT